MRYFVNIPITKASVSGYFEAKNEAEALEKAGEVFDGLLDLAEEGLGGDVIGSVVENDTLDLKNATVDNA